MTKIQYNFFGKECLIDRGLSDYSNLETNLQQLGFEYNHKPLFVNQIHSTEVVVIDGVKKIYSADQRPKADAIVTNIKNLPIAIQTADCLPILFIDEKHSVIAVAHAGWAGAKNNIIAATIKKMLLIGAKIENIKAIIGPCIRQKSYEVSADFFAEFMTESLENKIFFIPSVKSGHYMFDLPAYCRGKIHKEGIKEIADEDIDTYSNPEKLFSYRRSTHKGEIDCGRNVSVIMTS
jgi:YfiH family protein